MRSVNWWVIASLAVLTGAWGVAQVNISQPSPVNYSQVGGVAVSTGNGTVGTGVQRVAVASDNTAFTVNAAQSGTWTVQPGNTQNSTAWLIQLPASSTKNITSGTVTAVKATAGTLRRISLMTGVASATIKLFDLASASCTGTPSTNPQGVITLPSAISNPFTLEYQQAFVNGICVLTSGATNLTVVYD